MAPNALLLKLVEQSAAKYPQLRRDQYLPRASALDKLADHDRAAVLDFHRRQLEEEVCRTVLATSIGRRRFLKSARDRMRRLELLAHSYGYWLPKPEPEKLSEAQRVETFGKMRAKIAEMKALLEQANSA